MSWLEIPNSCDGLFPGFEVKQMFLEDSERFYKAKPVTLSGNNEADVVAINNWVKEATKGQIPSILSELPASTVMVLLNAVHFKGEFCCFLFLPPHQHHRKGWVCKVCHPLTLRGLSREQQVKCILR